ncbi:MAG: glycoside hydrolase family 127 protein, partial [Anaerolineaceae bacterium]|nr:glycoside hydrolase family 127 protein [Anaerolineaceae bacterium]
MAETFHFSNISITGGFWDHILKLNAETAIFHQWDELEKSGSIENFRIAAGLSEHFRTGFFFSDSDAYKWLDAACRISLHRTSPALKDRIDQFAALIHQAQEPDGYLYTYNQILFPDERWIALQIEHELYCHGHLIEACLSHDTAYPEESLLPAAIKAADLICGVFLDKPAHRQPGHQEIELALLSLYERTDEERYFEMASQFLDRRGRVRGHGWRLLDATIRSGRRGNSVAKREEVHRSAHPELRPFTLPPMNEAPASLGINLRFMGSALSGKYFQTHQPIADQNEAVGHSVRFGYTMAAETRRLRMGSATPDDFTAQESLWDEMVTRRMYVTGGLGSLPVLEGFGKDYELDPHLAYAETCATIASLFWDWELLNATGKAQYAELFEWQLYNAALVGVGQNGQCYLYNNPLAADGSLTREPWFRIPCCPSNISRVFAALGGYLYTIDENTLTIHQYVTSRMESATPSPLQIEMESGLPFTPSVTLTILASQTDTVLRLRVPGWAEGIDLQHNGASIEVPVTPSHPVPTAGGYSPFNGGYITLPGPFQTGDQITLQFHQSVRAHRVDSRVGLGEQNTALSLGPVVYCAEDIDNCGLDLDQITLDMQSFHPQPTSRVPGIPSLVGKDLEGNIVRLIPYFAWANRGPSKMRVFFK